MFPAEFARSLLGYMPRRGNPMDSSDDSSEECDCETCRCEKDREEEEWPNYTTEELFKHLKEMKNRVKQQASYRRAPCKAIIDNLIEMYKTVNNGKEWTFGVSEDDDFKIESTDDEVIVNYKIFMMAAEALPNAILIETNNKNTTKGFLKYAYCLDSTLGTTMLCNIMSYDYRNSQMPTLFINQSMKIPDWKIALILTCIKIAEESAPSLEVKYCMKSFRFLLASYYDSKNWEGAYIDMSDFDCMLLDSIYKSGSLESQQGLYTKFGHVAYQHFDNPKTKSILEGIEKTSQYNPFLNIFQEISFDIQLIERESIRIFSKEEKYKRIQKIITIFELADRRDDSSSVVDVITRFLIKLLKIPDEDLIIRCLKALSSSPRKNKGYTRCTGVLQALLPLLDRESPMVREEAYICGAKHLVHDHAFDHNIMQKLLSCFSMNPIPQANYLNFFTSTFKFCCTDDKYAEKALEIIQQVAHCIKDKEYFLQVLEPVTTLLSIPSLPSVYIETLVAPLDDLVADAIKTRSIDIVDSVQTLITSLLGAELTKMLYKRMILGRIGETNPETKEYDTRLEYLGNHFHIPEMLKFLVESGKELSPMLVSFFFDTKCFENVKINSDITNEELIANSLAKSKSSEAHSTLGRILNRYFVATGISILPQSEIDRLIDEKLVCPNIHEQENQKFIYSVAHFGDFNKIANKVGEFGCPYGFLYENDDSLSMIILLNYLQILEHNLFIRPKELALNEIYDAMTDCISASDLASAYVNIVYTRLNNLLEAHVTNDDMEDSSDEDDSDEYNSDDDDELMFDPYGYDSLDEDDDDDDDDDDDMY